MKAYSLCGINDLRFKDIDIPKIEKDWVLVKVKAAGICSSDIPRIYTKGTYKFPTIPGHEFSGVVEQVGDVKYSNLLSKRVGVFPLIPCYHCEQCKCGFYEMCENYDYIGSRRDGAFAEYVAVPARNLIELPSNVSFIEAAMLEPLSVALHAVNKVSITNNDNVAVVGTGMIGFATALWAQSKGAKSVCVFGRSASKKKIADDLGIEFKEISNNKEQFNVVIEAVGGSTSINESINLCSAQGRLVLMGNPASDILLEQNTYWRILRKQITVFGTWNSCFEPESKSDWVYACETLANKQVDFTKFVSHIFPKTELFNALELMRNHSEPYCKIIIDWS